MWYFKVKFYDLAQVRGTRYIAFRNIFNIK